MNRNIKEKSWNTIGEYLFENWAEKSSTEKQNTGKKVPCTLFNYYNKNISIVRYNNLA